MLELDRGIQQSRTQTSANSERGNKTGHNTLEEEAKLIYRGPHWYSCRAKKTIHLKLHDDPTSIETVELTFPNRGSSTIRQQQPIGGTADRGGNIFFC